MNYFYQQQQLQQETTSSSLPSSYSIINNYGVDAMERGDCMQAIESFREANRLLKDLIGMRQQQQRQQEAMTMEVDMDESSSSSSSTSASIFPSMSHATKDINYHGDEKYGYIYKNLIRLPSSNAIGVANHKEHCAAILFNLAVSHHLRGMYVTHSKPILDLRKAISFYELCQKVLIMKRIECGHCIYMAITNNLGIIYTILEGEIQAKPFFERLLSIQMLMIEFGNHFFVTTQQEETVQQQQQQECDSTSSSSSSSNIIDKENENNGGGFLYNTSRLLILRDCAAPAA